MWTYETKLFVVEDWIRTRKQFDNKEEAIKAAILWAEINLQNDVPVAVRMVKLLPTE